MSHQTDKRIYERRFAKHMRDLARIKRKKIVRSIFGRVHIGVDTMHRTEPARKIALLMRIKSYPYAGHNLTYED
jgi:hypothetical protein